MSEKETYALLIYRTGPAEPSSERSEVALRGHRELQRQASEKGELRAVARLHEVDRARTLRHVPGRVGTHEITDGPYVESKEWLVGFYLLDCSTEEEALERAKLICPLADHAIEVRPVRWHNDA